MFRRLPHGLRAHQPLGPLKLSWQKRLHQAKPGLRLLGIDPEGRRDQILGSLTRSHKDGWLDLLTRENKKLKKSGTRGFLAWGLTLSPDLESGIQTCPLSTYCAKVCLTHTGRMQSNQAQHARIRRTLYWWLFPEEFLNSLSAEMHFLRGEAQRAGLAPALRLNITSDIAWEQAPSLQAETGITFYDYTKLPWAARNPRPPDWHLLFSLSEAQGSLKRAFEWLDRGGNVAVVIGQEIPESSRLKLAALEAQADRMAANSPAQDKLLDQRAKWAPPGRANDAAKAAVAALLARGRLWGDYPVLNGDSDDARFLDDRSAWVLLHTKGPANYDVSGFVVRVRPDGTPVQDEKERRAAEIPWKELERAKTAFRALLAPDVRMERAAEQDESVAPAGRAARLRTRTRPGLQPLPFRPSRVPPPPVAPQCVTLPAPWWCDPWGGRLA